MIRKNLTTFLLGILLLGSARGQNLVDNPLFQIGCEAFQKKDYARAAAEFQETWSTLGIDANPLQQKAVASRLLETWYRNGDYETAVAWYKGHENLALGKSARKWAALSQLEGGFYDESAELFAVLSRDSKGTERRRISVYRAHALVRSGAAEKAYRVLIPDFSDPETPKDIYFYAGVAYETKRWKEGLAYCDELLKLKVPEFSPKAKILKARCLAGSEKTDLAVNLLLELIGECFDTPTMHAAFDLLVDTATAAENRTIGKQFSSWSEDPVFPERQMAARFYGILVDSESDEEILVGKLDSFILENPEHPLAYRAKLLLGSLRPELASQRALDDDPNAIEELKKHLSFEMAVKQFQEDSFSSAKESFLEISTQLKGREREQALFNSAISALYAGDDATYDSLEKELGKYGKVASATHADLLFLAGLIYSSQNNLKAFKILSNFTRNYPDHASVIDAKLAVAELHLNQVPPQPQAARKIFNQLADLKLSAARRERLDYARLWAELLSPGVNRVRHFATRFLSNWPKSEFRPEVSMLLASDFFEKQEYDQAEKSFRELARNFPESRFHETALFFAAKATSLKVSENNPGPATEFSGWDEVISAGGTLANAARHQKGIGFLKMDRFDDAVRIFDEILNSKEPRTNDLRLAVQCDKGVAIYLKALALDGDPKLLSRAAELFADVARDSKATRAWNFPGIGSQGQMP